MAWWSVFWTIGVFLPLSPPLMIPYHIGWGLEYWVFGSTVFVFHPQLSSVSVHCATEGGFSLCPSLCHTFAPPLVVYVFDVLEMGLLCGFGPTSAFGRLCISGLWGFTAPSLPSYGTLCFVSVEGFVRERASCFFPSLEDRALIVLLADPRVGNFSWSLPKIKRYFSFVLLTMVGLYSCHGHDGLLPVLQMLKGFERSVLARGGISSFPQWCLIPSFMPAPPKGVRSVVLSPCFQSSPWVPCKNS